MIDHPEIQDAIRRALAEDIGQGDITTESCIPEKQMASGSFIARERQIIAGIELLPLIYAQRGKIEELHLLKQSGQAAEPGETIARVRGPARMLLECERVALNFLQRLSGIATKARQFKNEVEGTNCQVLDTRKTTPGLRRLEKMAAAAGGITNHRMGLYDAVLIKNNHIAAAGGVTNAINRARQHASIRPIGNIDSLPPNRDREGAVAPTGTTLPHETTSATNLPPTTDSLPPTAANLPPSADSLPPSRDREGAVAPTGTTPPPETASAANFPPTATLQPNRDREGAVAPTGTTPPPETASAANLPPTATLQPNRDREGAVSPTPTPPQIEIEIRTRAELEEALAAGATRILLDNLDPTQAATEVRFIAGRAKVELSGGIDLDNVRAYAETGADFVSSGAITHSSRATDISFRLELE